MSDKDLKINLIKEETAVIVIDVQRDFFTKKDAEDPIDDLDSMTEIIKPLNSFLKESRELGLCIIFTKYIEIKGEEPRNIKEKYLEGFCEKDSKGAEIYELEVYSEIDFISEKFTWDAFTNPKLDKYLKEKNIKNLIITGVTTEMCVFSTVSSAFAKGYTVFIPMELVATQKKKFEMHEEILELINLYYGFVVKSENIISKLKRIKK